MPTRVKFIGGGCGAEGFVEASPAVAGSGVGGGGGGGRRVGEKSGRSRTIASFAGSRLIAAMAWEAGSADEPAAAGGTGVDTGAPT